ncbi:hypothetical protein RUND412_004397 [Rhizina undulata]
MTDFLRKTCGDDSKQNLRNANEIRPEEKFETWEKTISGPQNEKSQGVSPKREESTPEICMIEAPKYHSDSISSTTISDIKPSVTAENRHCCPECQKSFRYVSKLRDHELTHSQMKEYGCNSCSKRYVRKRELVRHIKKNHSKFLSSIDIDAPESLSSSTAAIKRNEAVVKILPGKEDLKIDFKPKYGSALLCAAVSRGCEAFTEESSAM